MRVDFEIYFLVLNFGFEFLEFEDRRDPGIVIFEYAW
jgi:hypothetical protein